jgi:hypothetical protein
LGLGFALMADRLWLTALSGTRRAFQHGMPVAATLLAVAVAGSAGAYRVVDRDDARYDGPELALHGDLGLDGRWGLAGELATAGEWAGGHGSCLGELALRLGPSLTLTPGPRWLHLRAAAGPGVVWARLYASLFDRSAPTMTASGDRWLPQAWASVGVSASLSESWSIGADALARFVPPATFHAEHVPAGASPDFYPTYRRSHDLSTLGASIGVTYRFP